MIQTIETHITIHNLNSLLSTKEIESTINNLPMKEASGTNSITGEFYIFKGALIPIFNKLFHTLKYIIICSVRQAIP